MAILELKYIIIEMKIWLERFDSIFELVEEKINKLEDPLIEIMQSEEQSRKRLKKNEHRREMWDTVNYTNIHVMKIEEKKIERE